MLQVCGNAHTLWIIHVYNEKGINPTVMQCRSSQTSAFVFIIVHIFGDFHMVTINPAISLETKSTSNVVRVAVPASVHNNLEMIQKVQREILGKLGCLACCSGWDIRFDFQKQFVVDKNMNIKEIAR